MKIDRHEQNGFEVAGVNVAGAVMPRVWETERQQA
jgi:hypothetical protein